MTSKKTVAGIAALVSALAALSVSIALMSRGGPRSRRVFMFERRSSGRLSLEARFLPRSSEDPVALYVDELLLGPSERESRPLFSRGTRSLSCFSRKGVVYVNLEGERLLLEADGSSAIKRGVSLLKKNVRKNFRRVKEVKVFVDGNPAFE